MCRSPVSVRISLDLIASRLNTQEMADDDANMSVASGVRPARPIVQNRPPSPLKLRGFPRDSFDVLRLPPATRGVDGQVDGDPDTAEHEAAEHQAAEHDSAAPYDDRSTTAPVARRRPLSSRVLWFLGLTILLGSLFSSSGSGTSRRMWFAPAGASRWVRVNVSEARVMLPLHERLVEIAMALAVIEAPVRTLTLGTAPLDSVFAGDPNTAPSPDKIKPLKRLDAAADTLCAILTYYFFDVERARGQSEELDRQCTRVDHYCSQLARHAMEARILWQGVSYSVNGTRGWGSHAYQQLVVGAKFLRWAPEFNNTLALDDDAGGPKNPVRCLSDRPSSPPPSAGGLGCVVSLPRAAAVDAAAEVVRHSRSAFLADGDKLKDCTFCNGTDGGGHFACFAPFETDHGLRASTPRWWSSDSQPPWVVTPEAAAAAEDAIRTWAADLAEEAFESVMGQPRPGPSFRDSCVLVEDLDEDDHPNSPTRRGKRAKGRRPRHLAPGRRPRMEDEPHLLALTRHLALLRHAVDQILGELELVTLGPRRGPQPHLVFPLWGARTWLDDLRAARAAAAAAAAAAELRNIRDTALDPQLRTVSAAVLVATRRCSRARVLDAELGALVSKGPAGWVWADHARAVSDTGDGPAGTGVEVTLVRAVLPAMEDMAEAYEAAARAVAKSLRWRREFWEPPRGGTDVIVWRP